MTKEDLREELEKIVKSGKVEHIGLTTKGFFEWVEVTEITFAELKKLNEEYEIGLIEGYDTDNITIFFK